MKAVVAAFNQEKALEGAFSVLTNLRMELFQALLDTQNMLVVVVLPVPVSTETLKTCVDKNIEF